MFWIELIIVLAIIFIGVRVGGTFLAMAGGIGMFIMTFILHVTPSDPPITVILIMIAVICAAATMQACGGLDYLVRIAEKILRKNPKMITVLAPVVAYIFTFMCGTGHIVYIFNITRSYEKDGKPVVDTNFNKEVILTKKDAQTSDIWEKVLTGAEYTAYHVGTDGKKYYYTYHVSEMKVDGYTTEITYKGDRQYSITVTNTKNWFDSLLPETGGMGKALLYALGVLLLCLVTATEYRKRKSTRSQSSYK